MELWTYDSFYAQQGIPPQEYFNREVLGDAAASDLPKLEAALAVAKAAAAKTKGWETSGNTETEAAGANNDTIVGAIQENIAKRKWHQDAAKAFLAGTLKDYGPYLGATGQNLIRAALIDTTLVPG